MAHLYSLFDFYIPYGNFNFILVLVLKFPGSLNLSFHNLSIHQFSQKNLSLAQFIPRIYNKIIIKILRYFWGVTDIDTLSNDLKSPYVFLFSFSVFNHHCCKLCFERRRFLGILKISLFWRLRPLLIFETIHKHIDNRCHIELYY